MRPTVPNTADTVRALIASVPEPRLRELVVECICAALRGLAASPEPSDATTRLDNGRRGQWSQARRAAQNAKRRAKRAQSGHSRQRRGRKLANANAEASLNGSESAARNGRARVTAGRLWEHAERLSPGTPWRVVAKEFGLTDAAAQAAQRDGVLPCTRRAAARFITL